MKQRTGSLKDHKSNKNVVRLAKKKKERHKLPMSGIK